MSLGLTFAPTCHFNLFGTIIDVNKFIRHLIVKKYFLNTSVSTHDVLDSTALDDTVNSFNLSIDDAAIVAEEGAVPFVDQNVFSALQHLEAETHCDSEIDRPAVLACRNPGFYPVQARSVAVDQFQALVERDLVNLKHNNHDTNRRSDNLTNNQRKALGELKLMQDVVVRKADKGGAVTVLDKGLYILENKKLLADVNTYLPIKLDPTSQFKAELTKLISEGVRIGVLTAKEASFLLVEHPQIPIFHSLPKLHKGGFPPSFRPIVSGIMSLNENMCEWVDALLQPLVKSIPGYIRDTKDVLTTLAPLPWKEGYT